MNIKVAASTVSKKFFNRINCHTAKLGTTHYLSVRGRLKFRSITQILDDPPPTHTHTLLTKFKSNDPPPPGNHMEYNLNPPTPFYIIFSKCNTSFFYNHVSYVYGTMVLLFIY